jgi:hypothetical protein
MYYYYGSRQVGQKIAIMGAFTLYLLNIFGKEKRPRGDLV